MRSLGVVDFQVRNALILDSAARAQWSLVAPCALHVGDPSIGAFKPNTVSGLSTTSRPSMITGTI